MDLTRRAANGRGGWATLAIAPILIVAAIAVWAISDRMLSIGPFDRAQIGWAVVVPLFLLAPAAAGLAARWTSTRSAMLVATGIAMALGGLIVLTLSLTWTRIGCQPVGQAEAALQAIPTGLAAGLGFLAAAGAAVSRLGDGPRMAIVAGVVVGIFAGLATLGAFAATYQVASCAYVPA